jgi:PRTRC genetic system protein B
MSTTNDITASLGTLYHPKSALVFYEAKGENTDVYVEHFDMDKNGCPINAHPLSEREANALAKALQTEKNKEKAFLKSNGIFPTNILHIDSNTDRGAVLWYTKAQRRQLYFVNDLDIANGMAYVPSMVWYASKNNLSVFALTSDRRPTEKTPLHFAPFFNIYEEGRVCMGSVTINIKNSASVEGFTEAWEDYFFNSYFSHLLGNNSPIKGNCVHLWKDLIQTGKIFPKEVLKKNNKTLKNLLP